jgi:hypothetical protein
MVYNFQTGNNKPKLLMEYESVTQSRHQCRECGVDKLNFLSYISIFRKQFYFVASGLKMMGLGNSDNNLETFCLRG